MTHHQRNKHFCLLACLIPMLIVSIGCDSTPRYTITLARFTQANQQHEAEYLLARAKTILKTNDVWIDRDQDGINVNYGHFPTSRSGSRGHSELKRARALQEQLLPGLYQFFTLTRLSEPDPPAQPSWNLLTRPCQYSLEIAVYFDMPEKNYYKRKVDAVRHVRRLREANERAYFVHGKFESRVYVKCLSAADVMGTNAQGQTILGGTPLMHRLRQQYEFHLENTQRVYTILPNQYGKRSRLAHRPNLVDVTAIQRDVTF